MQAGSKCMPVGNGWLAESVYEVHTRWQGRLPIVVVAVPRLNTLCWRACVAAMALTTSLECIRVCMSNSLTGAVSGVVGWWTPRYHECQACDCTRVFTIGCVCSGLLKCVVRACVCLFVCVLCVC